MSKAIIYAVNDNPQTVLAGGAVNPGTIIRRFGCNFALNGNGVSVNGDGYYFLDVNVVAAPTAAGPITATLYKDGVALPGATATMTTAAADEVVTLPIIAAIRKTCCDSGISAITCVLSTEATVNSFTIRGERE